MICSYSIKDRDKDRIPIPLNIYIRLLNDQLTERSSLQLYYRQ